MSIKTNQKIKKIELWQKKCRLLFLETEELPLKKSEISVDLSHGDLSVSK